ncbi:PAS domain S-box-containing protein [Microbacterium sp. SORGH_AS428]|uniref:PAS domain-containing sensor histidine kinase n=1 Tax=Microbacterium sp. SORGH_AS_0428 TaxID=3041788 RepID=UPI00286063E9|nr:PAS domain-containing sensor histidine kinase [Microbacterium sp. SORGH_AS_0428]MDR6199264.1 PAS domain S-box-containing protein [Microbacterium sp. SORGH_AS_0428]
MTRTRRLEPTSDELIDVPMGADISEPESSAAPAFDEAPAAAPASGVGLPVPVTAVPAHAATGALVQDWTAQVTSVAIVHLDVEGRVVGWNPGAEKLKGYTPEEILGSSFTRFYREEDRLRGVPLRLLAIAATRGSVEDNGWRVRADGSLFWAHVIITALRDDAGEVAGFVKIVSDLTAAKQREDAEFDFLRAFAHDFLSPITALRGYVDLMAEPGGNTTAAVERISAVTDHLATMIQDLSARLVPTRPRPARSRADASVTVREAAELVLPGDAYGRIRYRSPRSVAVQADPVALRRAIANLVDNAAKYSEGPIEISVEIDGSQVRIAISDRGRGIAPEDLERIFDPLERGRLSNPDDGGTGIGLASTKALIERQGGEVLLSSTVGKGTTATIMLPADDDGGRASSDASGATVRDIRAAGDRGATDGGGSVRERVARPAA